MRELEWLGEEKKRWEAKAIANSGGSGSYRFIINLRFEMDKAWMTQFIVVALSLAAKMEETQVPLLLDLQDKMNKTRSSVLI
ncbi:hypothetical protein RIF29_08697 [Crotalaria pallida]|uniref:Uncharacterized protein n=1 Tax=Crotalaria pallida TaxID=3830 RepID=A0AAN9IJC9_CROPI